MKTMEIKDTYPALLTSYEGGAFSLPRWRAYIEGKLPGKSPFFLSDMENMAAAGKLSFEKDYLPVLNAVAAQKSLRERAHDSFERATKNLENRIRAAFGRPLDADVIFYLGLCNGAGWAVEWDGRKTVLLGIEKIMELNWCGEGDLYGLLYHELGHLYHMQYGSFRSGGEESGEDAFLWQLYTEGVAMVFEQTLVGKEDFYHQDKNGWKAWCDTHFEEIRADFQRELPKMTRASQRYFGDWVSYHGYSDAGYYLGSRFVRFLLTMGPFEEMISLEKDEVKRFADLFWNAGSAGFRDS